MKRPYEMPGWCRNLIEAGRLAPGEQVLVFVDEPLAVQGSQLATAVKEAGGEPTFELWAGERPMSRPPGPILAAAKRATLAFFLSQAPHPEEAAARGQVLETITGHGGREIYLSLVTPELLEGSSRSPQPTWPSLPDGSSGSWTARGRSAFGAGRAPASRSTSPAARGRRMRTASTPAASPTTPAARSLSRRANTEPRASSLRT